MSLSHMYTVIHTFIQFEREALVKELTLEESLFYVPHAEQSHTQSLSKQGVKFSLILNVRR